MRNFENNKKCNRGKVNEIEGKGASVFEHEIHGFNSPLVGLDECHLRSPVFDV